MSLKWVDGFEDLSGIVVATAPVTVSAGRTGNGLSLDSASAAARVPLTGAIGGLIATDIATLGFAWYVTSLTTKAFLSFYSGGNTLEATLFVDTSGTLTARRGTGVVLGTSPPGIIGANRWVYVEVQFRLHDTLGQWIVRVDGIEVINVSAVDTKNGAVAAFDHIEFNGQLAGASNVRIDDLYLCTDSLSDPFFGDCRVDTLVPDGNGAVNQFVGSDGNSTDNYLLVDELPPSSTDWTGSPTVGERDLYTMSNLPVTSGLVYAVCPTMYVAKTEVGGRLAKPLLRRATTTAYTGLPLDTSYRMRQGIATVDPETAAAWTIANVNALQAGVEVG